MCIYIYILCMYVEEIVTQPRDSLLLSGSKLFGKIPKPRRRAGAGQGGMHRGGPYVDRKWTSENVVPKFGWFTRHNFLSKSSRIMCIYTKSSHAIQCVLIKGSLARKLPGYGRILQGQPCHHVITMSSPCHHHIIIMPS